MVEEIYVLGAGFAGLNTALYLARNDHNVKIVDRKNYHEFTPGIINLYDNRMSPERLKLNIEEFLENTEIEYINETVEALNPEEKTFSTDQNKYRYDKLIICLGGRVGDFGFNLSNIHAPYTINEALEIREEIEDSSSAIIVGSGYVGIETASELHKAGLEVTIIEKMTRPMPNSPDKASKYALEYLNSRGIKFKGGREVIKAENSFVETAEGEKLESDIVLWCTGIEAPQIMQECFSCSPNGLKVNSGMASEKFEDVFAVGDCADEGSLKTAHNTIRQAKVMSQNVSKSEGKPLERFDEGDTPLVVSIGKTGLFIYGDWVLKNRFFRYLKDLIRIRYWTKLKLRKHYLKLFS